VEDYEVRTCAMCGERFVVPRDGVPSTMTFTAAGRPPRCQIALDGRVRHRCPVSPRNPSR